VTEENRSTQRNLGVSTTLSTTNPMLSGFGKKPGLHIERPATNCLSHGTNHVDVIVSK